MDAEPGIPCVIYAAKSTEDRRGSIPAQLEECRHTIREDARRRLVAEYSDEAFSAYKRDRGPGLIDAIQHAEDLAAEHGVCELWAQHSDRLARGDGRAARHTVEVALWALKHDVKIRTLQDPDTFRDLVYAVVTGQRNNEDSKRKGLATQAGRKRAIARGEYVGNLPDGYRLVKTLEDGELCKRLELDPDRRPLIELIFRLAMRGRTCGQIAKTIKNQGWLTKPVRRADRPRPFDVNRIYELVRNSRYAALATYEGEVLARGHWPAYITEHQHQRIRRRLTNARERHSNGPLEAYLLRGIARCGHCGHLLRIATGPQTQDGTRLRTYVCGSHRTRRGKPQCPAVPLDAHITEAMLITSLPALLDTPPQQPPDGQRQSRSSSGGDYEQLSAYTERSQRRARELADTGRLRAWIDRESHGRTEATRREALDLSRLLSGWFTSITIQVNPTTVNISAIRRRAAPADAVTVNIDRTAWTRLAPARHRQMAGNVWARAEILGALQAWAEEHGRSPRRVDWKFANAEHPNDVTVCHTFKNWNNALRKARLPLVRPPAKHPWTDADIVKALRASATRHAHAPTYLDWAKAAHDHPCAETVLRRFGTWASALHAARLEPAPRPGWQTRRWTDEKIIEQLRAWTADHGRPPTGSDWRKASTNWPCAGAVRGRFHTWQAALQAAGLEPPPRQRGVEHPWDEPEILQALQAWADRHGQPPLTTDWLKATPGRPTTTTVLRRYGSWNTALRAAG